MNIFLFRSSKERFDAAVPQLGGSEPLSVLFMSVSSRTGMWLHDAGSDPARRTHQFSQDHSPLRLASYCSEMHTIQSVVAYVERGERAHLGPSLREGPSQPVVGYRQVLQWQSSPLSRQWPCIGWTARSAPAPESDTACRLNHIVMGLPVNWLPSSQSSDKFRKALQAAGSVPAQATKHQAPVRQNHAKHV